MPALCCLRRRRSPQRRRGDRGFLRPRGERLERQSRHGGGRNTRSSPLHARRRQGLAAEGKVSVDRVLVDGRTIAAAIILRSGRCAWFWKIAYDETFARFSPGVMLSVALTDELVDDASDRAREFLRNRRSPDDRSSLARAAGALRSSDRGAAAGAFLARPASGTSALRRYRRRQEHSRNLSSLTSVRAAGDLLLTSKQPLRKLSRSIRSGRAAMLSGHPWPRQFASGASSFGPAPAALRRASRALLSSASTESSSALTPSRLVAGRYPVRALRAGRSRLRRDDCRRAGALAQSHVEGCAQQHDPRLVHVRQVGAACSLQHALHRNASLAARAIAWRYAAARDACSPCREGTFSGDPDRYVANCLQRRRRRAHGNENVKFNDGRIIALTQRPLQGGGWVTTHTDVTEKLAAEEERDTLRVREERRVAIDADIASFRGRVENVIKIVGQSAAAMKAAAKSLLTTSDHTLQRAEGAVHGSNEASANVETAAAAAEELSASIKEISRRLGADERDRAQRRRRRHRHQRRYRGARAASPSGSATWSSSFRTSPNRPISWRSMPPSRRRAPAKPAAALPWSPRR